MSSYSFNVNTEPMARKMDGVTSKVGKVGAAVTAMQLAVIAEEKQATKKICESIDSGFYLMLRSKLSQRISQFASAMNSRVGSMMETAAAIDRTHHQMVDDFNRIKARYTKLFGTLDQTLEDRVSELDRPAMDLARIRTSVIVEGQCREAPSALFYARDIHNVALKASSARVKARAQDSINMLSDGTRRIRECYETTEAIMDDRPLEGTPFSFVPVVYAVEESIVEPGSYSFDVCTPMAMEPEKQAEVARGVRARNADLTGASARDLQTIRSSLISLIADQHMDGRVANTMVALFDASFSTQQAPTPATPGAPNPQGGMR